MQSGVNWYHEITLFLFVIFIVGLASQTVIPKIEFGVDGFGIVQNGIHNTNLIPFKVLTETYNEVFVNGNVNYFIINFLGNIILFFAIWISDSFAVEGIEYKSNFHRFFKFSVYRCVPAFSCKRNRCR